MGCDYYIVKYIDIYYSDGSQDSFESDRDRGYYYFKYDEDNEDYEEKREEYILDLLCVETKPIPIYDNGQFKSRLVELKYKSLIEDKMGKNKKWEDIVKVEKTEMREER
jgi:hypothetical protein